MILRDTKVWNHCHWCYGALEKVLHCCFCFMYACVYEYTNTNIKCVYIHTHTSVWGVCVCLNTVHSFGWQLMNKHILLGQFTVQIWSYASIFYKFDHMHLLSPIPDTISLISSLSPQTTVLKTTFHHSPFYPSYTWLQDQSLEVPPWPFLSILPPVAD